MATKLHALIMVFCVIVLHCYRSRFQFSWDRTCGNQQCVLFVLLEYFVEGIQRITETFSPTTTGCIVRQASTVKCRFIY